MNDKHLDSNKELIKERLINLFCTADWGGLFDDNNDLSTDSDKRVVSQINQMVDLIVDPLQEQIDELKEQVYSQKLTITRLDEELFQLHQTNKPVPSALEPDIVEVLLDEKNSTDKLVEYRKQGYSVVGTYTLSDDNGSFAIMQR